MTKRLIGLDGEMSDSEILRESPRIALIGDVQGYAHRLEVALRNLGAEPDCGTLPEEMTVRAVDSLGIVYYINFCGGQWESTVVSLPEGGRSNNGVHSARGSGRSSPR